MIAKLRQLLNSEPSGDQPSSSDGLQVAAAALLVEVMVADRDVDSQEQRVIEEVLKTRFALSDSEVKELFAEAQSANREATCLYRFTRQINERYGAAERFQLVVELWRTAYADGQLDKYEEGTIRQICELIHVSHSDFIRAKHLAKDQ
ncbi:TerB family tellurite resistance protein [Porticoccus sp. W117]|uniref:tellurite resistance TerB family protein n=1 Tax=Porticoccus sp. W117 TaxID=3054777 RepID=UPI002599E23A|nr:TerB family tellurite resistance protein [Porticoccus sp. W117]MDM3870180.1 TerB family tellurite resistance protein [Porticoccus sp. W117]